MSEQGYVPTEAEIRESYRFHGHAVDDHRYLMRGRKPLTDAQYEAEFDLWLARRDAQVRADALEEAADDLTPGDDKVDDWGIEAGLLRERAAALRREGSK